MGVHGKIDPITDADITTLTAADGMLAQVLAEYAIGQAEEARKKNRAAIGADTPYIAAVDATLVPDMPNMSEPAVRVLTNELEKMFLTYSGPRNKRGRLNITFTFTIPPHILAVLFPYSAIAVPLIATYRSLWASIGGRFLIRALEKAAFHRLRNSDDPDPVGVLMWIATELRDRSPVYTGAYRDAHRLFADGREVANAEEVATGHAVLPKARAYEFRNEQPYARRLEIGKTESGRDFLISVPNRVYERVARDARKNFRDVADIDYDVSAKGSDPSVSIQVSLN